MATPLDALLNTLYESGNPETPESAAERAAWNEDNAKRPRRRRRPPLPGFAEGSERWHDALLAQVPLVEYDLAAATPQPGLFDPQLTPRYGIDEAHLYASPYAYAGPPPDGAGDFDELIDHHTPIAWDQTRVMCACPRAMCLIDRKRWNQGYRFCPGCRPPVVSAPDCKTVNPPTEHTGDPPSPQDPHCEHFVNTEAYMHVRKRAPRLRRIAIAGIELILMTVIMGITIYAILAP